MARAERQTVTPRTVTYTLGPLNRQSVTDAGVVTTYGTASGMSQYRRWAVCR